MLTAVMDEDGVGKIPKWTEANPSRAEYLDRTYFCEPRGIGAATWTRKNGPNYVERSLALLGRTADTGRVLDVIVTAHAHPTVPESTHNSYVAGNGAAGIIAAYAAILDETITGVGIVSPPTSLMDKDAPQFLNALRVCDVPDALGLIAPRPLTIITASPEAFDRTKATYEAAGAADKLTIKK